MSRSRRRIYEAAARVQRPVEACFHLLPLHFVRMLLRWFRWSDGLVGQGIRYLCVRRLAKACGRRVLIFPGCQLHWLERCRIGENVTIHDFCYLDACGEITIGDDVRIAHNCSLISGQHRFDVPGSTIIDSGYTLAPVVIEDDVWLGTGAVVMPGVTIGTGAVVAANSAVTVDVAPFAIVGGVPARFIKGRLGDVGERSAEG